MYGLPGEGWPTGGVPTSDPRPLDCPFSWEGVESPFSGKQGLFVWTALTTITRNQQMPSRMTATAYWQGVKNALVCGAGILVTWLLIVGAVSLATGTPFRSSYGIAFAVLWGFVFLWFLAAWLYGRQAAGQTVLDCGPHPCRKLFLLNAVLFLVLGPCGGFTVGSASSVWCAVFGVSFGVYWLIMAGGRLQVRENGIWQYWGLLRWPKIESYRWANDCTWLVRTKGFSFLWRGALPVPPEYKDAFDQLLQKHCVAEDGKRA
jgi:hypothetical protein